MHYEKFSQEINPKTYIENSVKKNELNEGGVIILIGPSGCGKSEIGKSLCSLLTDSNVCYLSMGDILRSSFENSTNDLVLKKYDLEKHGISDKVCIYDMNNNNEDLVKKAILYKDDITKNFKSHKGFVSQLDWLEFCVKNGLLVPDHWTIKLIDGYLEHASKRSKRIVILDGYPRTTIAAQNLLITLKRLDIPVIKVIHLFITREQMNIRLENRGREDDTTNSVERRYEFYLDKVQPTVDYLKQVLGNSFVSIVDAHQPITNNQGKIDVEASIGEVVKSIIDLLKT